MQLLLIIDQINLLACAGPYTNVTVKSIKREYRITIYVRGDLIIGVNNYYARNVCFAEVAIGFHRNNTETPKSAQDENVMKSPNIRVRCTRRAIASKCFCRTYFLLKHCHRNNNNNNNNNNIGRTRLKINGARVRAARLQVACQKFDSQPLAPLHWFSAPKNFHEKRSSARPRVRRSPLPPSSPSSFHGLSPRPRPFRAPTRCTNGTNSAERYRSESPGHELNGLINRHRQCYNGVCECTAKATCGYISMYIVRLLYIL